MIFMRSFLLISALLGLAPLVSLADGSAKRKVIIDQDAYGPAGSNLQSILMLIQSPSVQLEGITVMSGDGWRDENVAHTLRLLEIIGRTDIPVVPGAVNPLINTPEATKRWEAIYGKLVYKGCWTEKWPATTGIKRRAYHAPDVVPSLEEGDPHTKASTETAVDFLIRKVHAEPGQITIIAAGPLTDIALACAVDPEFPKLVKELVIMGGSFEPIAPGGSEYSLEYLYTPRLEFNIRWDAEASKMVFHAPWKKIVQVPIDPTTKTGATAALFDQIAKAGTPLAAYLKKFGEVGMPMWDEVASGVWLDPSLVTEKADLLVDVDTSFTAGYGNTLSWALGAGPGLGEQPVTVIKSVDVDKLDALFVKLMSAPTPKP